MTAAGIFWVVFKKPNLNAQVYGPLLPSYLQANFPVYLMPPLCSVLLCQKPGVSPITGDKTVWPCLERGCLGLLATCAQPSFGTWHTFSTLHKRKW